MTGCARAVVLAALLLTLPVRTVAAQQDRDAWQRVSEVLEALAADEGAVIADLGAGRGFYTGRLARRVGPSGRVYAVDIAADALRTLRLLADTITTRNVVVVEGRVDDPLLPADALDGVLIVNAYHEMTAHDSIVARLFTALRSGGRLVLLEPSDSTRGLTTREAQERAHTIASSFARADLERAGFEVVRLEEAWARTPGSRRVYWLMVARRPPGLGSP